MKIWQWNSLLLMTTLIVCCLFFTKERIYRFDSNYANDFNACFLEENTDYIESLDLQELQLEISKENIDNISELQEFINNFDFETFQNQNDWKPAQISLNEKSFPVEFKVHGKTPNGQSVGEHISLGIRSEEPILGQNRLNLIIYERISVNADRIAALGEAFELIYQPDELVRVEINQSKSKLYYLETPLKKSFLGKHGLINFELEHQKCPIINQLSNEKELQAELSDKIDKVKFSRAQQIQISAAYYNLNNSIINNNVVEIQNSFDLNYIARFQIARFIAGFQNHGFSPENLFFALDTSNFLFYPILHRDNYFDALDTNNLNSWTPYYYENVAHFKYTILCLITKNEDILAEMKNILEANESNINNLIIDLDGIDQKHHTLLQSNGLFHINLFESHQVSENYGILKEWLRR